MLGAGWGAGVGPRLARSLRTAMIVALPIVLVNVLVSRQGLTVFARLGDLGPFGQGDLTVEAVAYGGVIALKVTLLILITGLAGLAVDPDELLRMFRRLSFRSALTATLATRMLPVLAADSQRLAEAQRTRPGWAPRRAGAWRCSARWSAARWTARWTSRRRSRCAASRRRAAPGRARRPAAAAVAPRHRLRGIGGGDPRARDRRAPDWRRLLRLYPRLEMPTGAGTLALAVALIAATLLPFCDRRGIDP